MKKKRGEEEEEEEEEEEGVASGKKQGRGEVEVFRWGRFLRGGFQERALVGSCTARAGPKRVRLTGFALARSRLTSWAAAAKTTAFPHIVRSLGPCRAERAWKLYEAADVEASSAHGFLREN